MTLWHLHYVNKRPSLYLWDYKIELQSQSNRISSAFTMWQLPGTFINQEDGNHKSAYV